MATDLHVAPAIAMALGMERFQREPLWTGTPRVLCTPATRVLPAGWNGRRALAGRGS